MNVERFHAMNRVNIYKNNGFLDVLIDRSLVWEPDRRISWKEFKKIYTQGKYPQPSNFPSSQVSTSNSVNNPEKMLNSPKSKNVSPIKD